MLSCSLMKQPQDDNERDAGLRPGARYIADIANDGRQVYIDGDLVKDVTRRPAFAGAPFIVGAHMHRTYDYEAADKLVDYALSGYDEQGDRTIGRQI